MARALQGTRGVKSALIALCLLVPACGAPTSGCTEAAGDLLRPSTPCDADLERLHEALAQRRTLYAGVPDTELPAGLRDDVWRLARCVGP